MAYSALLLQKAAEGAAVLSSAMSENLKQHSPFHSRVQRHAHYIEISCLMKCRKIGVVEEEEAS